ncbi:hypothetical protein ABTZ03_30890 [Kitasatospora sp. NPDC096077]
MTPLDQVFFAFFATCTATALGLLVALYAEAHLIPPYLDRQEATDA